MKLRNVLLLLVILAFSATPAFAQIDPGVVDTVIVVPTVIPDFTTGTDQLRLDIYCYTDELIAGYSAGFSWDNPNVVMDSATANPATIGNFGLISFFENYSIATTNANQRFVLGGLTFGATFTDVSGTRSLWHSYYFTVSSWTEESVINVDSLTFDASSAWLFSGEYNIYPIFAGALEIRDTAYHPPAPANLVISETELNFTAVEGGTNPATQQFNVASDSDPLDFTITEFTGSPWLSSTPLTGTTPDDITVTANISGLTPASYKDTLVITSAGADNSPQYVVINLTVTPDPKSLAVSADTLFFTAVEDGADPIAQILSVSEVGGDPIAYEVTETSANVTLTNPTGTTPGDVTVNAVMGSLIPGTYYYDLTVTSAAADNSPLTVVVEFIISPRDRELVTSADSLHYTAVEGDPNPAGQYLVISEIGGDAIDYEITGTSEFVKIDDSLGTTPDSALVSMNLSSLGVGDHYFTLDVNSGDAVNSPVPVVVHLTLTQGDRELVLSDDTLYFTIIEDFPATDEKYIIVSELGGNNIPFNYNAFYIASWLSIDDSTGVTPDSGFFTVDVAGLTAGDYLDSMLIYSDDAINSPYFYINLTVTPRDRELAVTPDTLKFTAVEEVADTDAQYLVISEIGDDNIAYTIDVASIPSWLAIDNATSTTPDSSRVAVSAVGMTEGIYLDSMLVSSAGAVNSPYAFFEFTVTPRTKVLVVAPDTLKFAATEGDPNPDMQGFEVTEEGGAVIDYSVFESTDWFSVDSPTGTTPDSTYVLVNISGVGVGTYYGDVTFIDDAPPKASYIRTVMLTIAPPDNDPPVLDPIGPKEVAEGSDLTFVVTASDPNGTDPIISAYGLPDGATLDDTGLFVWWPTHDQAGIYPVMFEASDGLLADSEIVEITVTNVNQAPHFTIVPNDTTIDECMTLSMMIIGGDDPDLDASFAGIETALPDNMTDSIVSDTMIFLDFAPDTTQAGVYPITVFITDNEDTVFTTVTITVEDCVPCVPMTVSDTSYYFVDTIDVDPTGGDLVNVTSSGSLCYTVDNAFDEPLPGWFHINVNEPCTPGHFTFSYDLTGYPEGYYDVLLEVVGSPNVCLPDHQFVSIGVQLVDTTTPAVPSDSILVGTTPAVPGSQVIVPVNFTNSCDLFSIFATIEWYSDYLILDSVSWAGSAVGHFVPRFDTIYQFGKRAYLYAMDDTALVPPGYWDFANLHFSVAVETPPGSFLPIQVEPWSEVPNSGFGLYCGGPDSSVAWPEEIPGGIIVDSSYNFVCGYVVDTAGVPIPGATVELYGEFPIGPSEDMTTTNGSGAFAFSDFYTTPFDLWAHHPGYYPGLVENINYGDIGIMIVLTPIDEITPTYEWVNFYCSTNTYFDEPLPVGSVIDAYDPDNVHCGSYYVSEAGVYGFLPVYRDDEFTPEDEGADPDDNIRFFVNGMEAQAFGETMWTANGDSWEVCLDAGEVTIYCDLHEGWNLVSWRVDHESDYILDALASIDECLELVLGFEHGGLTYDPNEPFFSTLWEVDHLSGYWIKVSCDITLEISGAPVSGSTPIEVYSGWNLVSYLPDFGMGIQDGFSTLDDNLLVSLGENGIYIPDDVGSTLLDLEPCKGYWVKVVDNSSLVYPVAGPAVVAQNTRSLGNSYAAKAATDITPTTNWINLYANDLTVDGSVVKAGATISAFTQNGIKAGSYTMTEDGLFGFMPVYADDISTEAVEGIGAGESFYLTIDNVEMKETFTFDGGNGSKVELSNLTAGDHTDVLPINFSLSQNYPNPFNPTTTIEFSLPTAGKTKIEVYNILGELVSTPFDGIAAAGANSIVWDGTNSKGQNVSSGIYFYRLTADEYTETKKMTLLK